MTGKDSIPVEIRRVETEYYETGQGGNRTDVTYEVGGTIGGKWVRFASVPETTVDALPDPAQDEGKASNEQKAG
jgi:hypothetical protein